MRNTWAVCKREFLSYFITPVGYVVVGVFAVLSGLGFAASFLGYARATLTPSAYGYVGVPDFEENLLSPFLVFCGLLIMFIGPLVTMRLLAEEKNRGTAELLLTYPLRNAEIIFGKYGAALGMLLVMMAVVSVQMGVVWYFVPYVEPAVLGFGVVTVFLMGAAFLSMGLFVSSITRNQVTAGTATFGLWFVSYVLGSLSKDLPDAIPLPEAWPSWAQTAANFAFSVFRAIATELPLDVHAQDMAQGIFQPEDILYYVLFSAFWLFLTFRVLETRLWRT
ncbi:MAG TPA: ABC transporter permease subunit [Candidatus Hydrogenedentes bacterium]|mgnify:FL=1|nr:ABC transporter permease subunit [Candidatus Hydrogenedentota bacterium]HQM50788.1 ABC transporter permease subunit [Candidatus Hydrogenedentota bacterium]